MTVLHVYIIIGNTKEISICFETNYVAKAKNLEFTQTEISCKLLLSK